MQKSVEKTCRKFFTTCIRRVGYHACLSLTFRICLIYVGGLLQLKNLHIFPSLFSENIIVSNVSPDEANAAILHFIFLSCAKIRLKFQVSQYPVKVMQIGRKDILINISKILEIKENIS